ncbi:MAG: NAD-dependent epimerase/dehydratase family protein [Candidatus Rokuibacteriota bacterium]
MKALVTGGAGFIGSHLVESLLASGHDVTVIDDLSTGSADNLAMAAASARLRTRWASVFEEDTLQALVDDADVVYHLAAAVGVRLILDRPVQTLETNVVGTERVLRSAAKGAKTVVLASTSEVYGKNDKVPLREDDDCILGPTGTSRWSYACSKAIDEFFGLAYCRDRGVPVVIVRYFNTIGPRQTGRYGMVVPRFVQHALAGEPIIVYGDGEQTRSFTDVRDAVRATLALSTHPGAACNVFNVGNGHEVSVNDLAYRVKKLTGSASEIRHVSYEEAYERGFEEPRRRVPDVTKLRATLGFAPSISLDDSLTKVIEYYRSKPRSC